jgi:hypothetical protein
MRKALFLVMLSVCSASAQAHDESHPLLVLSEPAASTPEATQRLRRPIVLIHAGHESQDALRNLTARLASDDFKRLRRQLVVLVALSTDEGQSGDSTNVDCDYMKLVPVGACTVVDAINRWDPHAVIDLLADSAACEPPPQASNVPHDFPDSDARLSAFTRERIWSSGGASSLNSYVGLRNRLGVCASEASVPEVLANIATNATRLATLIAQVDAEMKIAASQTRPLDRTRMIVVPRGWLFPRVLIDSGRLSGVVDQLRAHGIKVQRLTTASEVPVERFVNGHQEAAMLSATEGALFVPVTQTLGRLAFYLLESEPYPIYRVLDASGLRLSSTD